MPSNKHSSYGGRIFLNPARLRKTKAVKAATRRANATNPPTTPAAMSSVRSEASALAEELSLAVLAPMTVTLPVCNGGAGPKVAVVVSQSGLLLAENSGTSAVTVVVTGSTGSAVTVVVTGAGVVESVEEAGSCSNAMVVYVALHARYVTLCLRCVYRKAGRLYYTSLHQSCVHKREACYKASREVTHEIRTSSIDVRLPPRPAPRRQKD